MFPLVNEPTQSSVIKDGPAGPAGVTTIAAGKYDSQRMFRSQKFPQLFLELKPLHELGKKRIALGSERMLNDASQLFLIPALKQSLVDRPDFAHRAEQDNFAGELAFVPVKVFLSCNLQRDCQPAHGVAGGRRPGRSLGNEYRC